MRIYSIFKSIDGEINHFHQGRVTIFIRFAGCNLNCHWCDTKYALNKNSGKEMNVNQIMEEVRKLGGKNVTITGGEPLMQHDGFLDLTKGLWKKDYKVSVETNGSYFPNGINVGSWVVDYKLKSSGAPRDKMMEPLGWARLRECDFVKFVIATIEDFNEANEFILTLKEIGCRAKFAFSPAWGILDPKILISWLDSAKMNDVIINLQLHKYLGLVEDQ